MRPACFIRDRLCLSSVFNFVCSIPPSIGPLHQLVHLPDIQWDLRQAHSPEGQFSTRGRVLRGRIPDSDPLGPAPSSPPSPSPQCSRLLLHVHLRLLL